MKVTLLFFCAGMFYLGIYSQDARIEISGNIYEFNSNSPLVNASIKIMDKNLGAYSNELGQFFLISNKLPVTLVISYVGYETQEIDVEFEPLQPITIYMKAKTELLKGVVITTEKIDTIYQDKHYSVMDYALLSEGIMLLVYRNTLNRSEIILIDYIGNTLALMNTLPGKPLRLFKDCLGKVHLFTQNKSYEISIVEKKLELYPSIDLNEFIQIMQYCELFHHGKLYYHKKEYLDLINIYYTIDTTNKEQVNFYTVLDQDKIDFLAYNPENISLLNRDISPSLNQFHGLPSDKAILDQIRNSEVELRFNQMAYFPAIYAPIFELGDSIVIFNHPNATIDFFNDQDTLVKSIPINYHKNANNDIQVIISSISRNEKWQKDVYIDAFSQKAYTSFLNSNGTKIVKEINLQTGQLIKPVKIPFPYVQNIQFRNGYLFYIYKGWEESQKKKLFRQRLD